MQYILGSCLIGLVYLSTQILAIPHGKLPLLPKALKVLIPPHNNVDQEDSVFDRSVDSYVEVEGVRCGYFIKYTGKALFGFNTKRITDVDISECLRSCAKERGFYCRSVDFNGDSSSSGQHTSCYLSSESVDLQPEDLDNNFNTDYYERSCTPPEEPEGSANGGILF